MGAPAVLLLTVVGSAAYLVTVWLSTDSKPIRFWAILAVVGSLILGIAAIVTSACNLAENRSALFYDRCEGSIPYIPLYAIPVLLGAPILRRFVSGAVVFGLGSLLLAVAVVVPLELLSV